MFPLSSMCGIPELPVGLQDHLFVVQDDPFQYNMQTPAELIADESNAYVFIPFVVLSDKVT